jgi:hypothetical protein
MISTSVPTGMELMIGAMVDKYLGYVSGLMISIWYYDIYLV